MKKIRTATQWIVGLLEFLGNTPSCFDSEKTRNVWKADWKGIRFGSAEPCKVYFLLSAFPDALNLKR